MRLALAYTETPPEPPLPRHETPQEKTQVKSGFFFEKYEFGLLDDIVWDDFERSSDQIVGTEDDGSGDKCKGGTCKKPRLEVTPLQSNVETETTILNIEKNMTEEGSCSHIPDGVFTSSGDAESAKDTPTLQSGDTKLSDDCFKSSNVTSGSELCTDEGILKETSGAVDSNSYNDLNLFTNDGVNKGSSDLIYYGWPDIGNFEDMDTMLSNCDSSFGLGVPGNDDELVWFTSEDPAGGYEEAMNFKFPCSESSALTNVSQDHECRESDAKGSSFVSQKVHGSTASPPVVPENLSCQQTGNKADDKISSTGKD
ncbi:hypothetical protein CTI12_AA527560 [Artemisia annua]|uniref:Uncharacterized protein n=1 Tax=Artemisia annua TaxID=35608 RepID=A0A2U1L5C5_ARTAN|nr:hypothetical protein CTI12_AA527560 [Artemisia annua]